MAHNHLLQHMLIFTIISISAFLALFCYHLYLPSSLFISVTGEHVFLNHSSRLPCCRDTLSVTEDGQHQQQQQLNSSVPLAAVVPDYEETHVNVAPKETDAAAEKRISRLMKQLPDIIQSNELTPMFDLRVRAFFSEDCDVRFFMTWISPVKSFGRREFLALESVFKAHPSGCLMILSGSLDSEKGRKLLKPLTNGGHKAASVSPDFDFLMKDTPAESWFGDVKKGKVDPGTVPFPQNLSNLLRLAVIYKYGGVYLDTDVIVLKNFSELKNTIGAQSVDEYGNWTRLNNAVLVFDEKHPLVFQFIKEFSHTFNGNRWGYNGPSMVSRVAERPQNSTFTILPPKAFYPVNWIKIGRYFRRQEGEAGKKWTAAKVQQLSNGQTFAIHLWNKVSRRFGIEEGSILERLVSDHCLFSKNISSILSP